MSTASNSVIPFPAPGQITAATPRILATKAALYPAKEMVKITKSKGTWRAKLK